MSHWMTVTLHVTDDTDPDTLVRDLTAAKTTFGLADVRSRTAAVVIDCVRGTTETDLHSLYKLVSDDVDSIVAIEANDTDDRGRGYLFRETETGRFALVGSRVDDQSRTGDQIAAEFRDQFDKPCATPDETPHVM